MDDDNLEEFQDPRNYDREFGGDLPCYRFYTSLARRSGGPVLELGCGTGLASLPVARLGIEIVGVDVSAPMIEHARSKADGLPVTFVRADAREFRAGRRFSLVFMTGNAFQAFLTDADQSALLATVRAHLEPGGLFAFETRNPAGTDLASRHEEAFWHTFEDGAGNTVRVSGTQRYDAATATMHWVTIRRWPEHETRARIACRFTGRSELADLLARGGFEITRQYGGWDHEPLAEDSPMILSVCRVTSRGGGNPV